MICLIFYSSISICSKTSMSGQGRFDLLDLKKERYLQGLEMPALIHRLAYYLGELNAVHPFREGNGRVQRLFIEYLAENNGYYLDFSKVSPNEGPNPNNKPAKLIFQPVFDV